MSSAASGTPSADSRARRRARPAAPRTLTCTRFQSSRSTAARTPAAAPARRSRSRQPSSVAASQRPRMNTMSGGAPPGGGCRRKYSWSSRLAWGACARSTRYTVIGSPAPARQ